MDVDGLRVVAQEAFSLVRTHKIEADKFFDLCFKAGEWEEVVEGAVTYLRDAGIEPPADIVRMASLVAKERQEFYALQEERAQDALNALRQTDK